MRRWGIISALLMVLILTGVTACSPGSQEAVEQVVEVVRGDLIVSVSGSGNIKAVTETRLSFGSGGRISQILVEEGDEVSKGEVLARLDTGPLELSRSQAEFSLTQAEVALTQAELAQKTAEYNLKKTRDTESSLELALFNAQIEVRNAEHHLDETRDIYTWPEIQVAKDEAEDARAFLQYVMEKNLPLETVEYARARLEAAEAKLDAMIRSYDTEEVAIARLQLEAAEKAEAQARKNLDDLQNDIALQELQVEAAKASVEQARQSAELARKSLREAQRQLDEAIITAPFDGVITEVNAEEGDTVASSSLASQPVFRLINSNQMELLVEVDEIDIPNVQAGQEAIITLDALPDREFPGEVVTIFPQPKEIGGVVLYDVKIKLDVQEGSGIRIGMSASADIVLARRSNVLLVPDRAIGKDSEGNTVVRVVVGEQIQERPVVIGLSDGFDTEIISGLSEGEKVLETRVRR